MHLTEQPTMTMGRRRTERINLTLPAHVEYAVEHPTQSWKQLVKLSDVSMLGAGFVLPHAVKPGKVLMMTIPMPRTLRVYDWSTSFYTIWAIVRHCVPRVNAIGDAEGYVVGVAFIGQTPPDGYYSNPHQMYTASQEGKKFWQIAKQVADCENPMHAVFSIDCSSAGRDERLPIQTEFILESMDKNGNVIARDVALTENLSKRGAALFTALECEEGNIVRISCYEYKVCMIGVVKTKRTCKNNLPRVHIEFIDRFFPIHKDN